MISSFKTVVYFSCLAIATALPMGISHADIHRSVDKDGDVHLSNISKSKSKRTTQKGGITSTVIHLESTTSPPRPSFSCTAHPPYVDTIVAAATSYNVDPALVAATIRVESNFNPKALSAAGAQGLMQLMPSTAARLGVNDPYQPTQNIRGGAKYLSELLSTFDGDIDFALAAYNAGPPAVRAYGGLPPFKETIDFVARVKSYLACYGDRL